MSAYLDTIKPVTPEATTLLEEIKRTNNKRLWHQLTKALRKFVVLDEVQPYLVDFFQQFLKNHSKSSQFFPIRRNGTICSSKHVEYGRCFEMFG